MSNLTPPNDESILDMTPEELELAARHIFEATLFDPCPTGESQDTLALQACNLYASLAVLGQIKNLIAALDAKEAASE